MPDSKTLHFSNFELRMHEHRLLVGGVHVDIGSRAFDLLAALAERPGELLTKRQLIEIAWPETVVQENNLPKQISALRKALGSNVIATVSGRGYRFTARVVSRAPQPTSPSASTLVEQDKQRTNLPRSLQPMVGRETELAALDAFVDRLSLVTIVGPGGMGKSLLALHLLTGRSGKYPHGVCWVELASLSEAAVLPGAIAAALGLQLAGGDSAAALGRALAPLQLLLALDNAEHLLEDVRQLVDTLREAAPGLSVLVTSQSPIRAPGEQVFRLAPLTVPDGPLSASQARAFGAVALFEGRARSADRHFSLTDANVADCVRLCRALDGLPLAIELAAARTAALGLEGLVASLDERLDALASSSDRWRPARQQTLRATIEWSHGFLDERERVVFRRLAVVLGSASLELVNQLVGAPEPDGSSGRWSTLDTLQLLVDRSLLTLVPSDVPSVGPRYRLLQSPRAFALEKLAASDEVPSVSRRHAQAMADLFAKGWLERWDGSIGVEQWGRKLEPDLDNAREALAWAHAHGEAHIALKIGMTLLYALPRSQYAERLAVGDTCKAVLDGDVPPTLQLQAWLALSSLWIDSHWPRSGPAIEQATRLARELCAEGGADIFWLYLALSQTAVVSARNGDVTAAMGTLDEMRLLEDPRWPPHRLVIGAAGLALVSYLLESPDAVGHARRHWALRKASGSQGHTSLSNLVSAEVAAGDAQSAVETGAALMTLLEGTRDEYSLSYARLDLAAAWLSLGNTTQARAVAQAGLLNAQRFEHMIYWADYLALLAALEGRHEVAARLAGFSDNGYRQQGKARLGNEARFFDRGCDLARAELGADRFDLLAREGALLLDAEIGPLALGT